MLCLSAVDYSLLLQSTNEEQAITLNLSHAAAEPLSVIVLTSMLGPEISQYIYLLTTPDCLVG